MPITLGLDDATGLGNDTALTTDPHLIKDNAIFAGVLPAGEQFTEVGFIERGADTAKQIEIGIYDITAGTNSATLIHSEILTTTAVDLNRNTATFPGVGIPGNTYAVAFRAVTNIKVWSTFTGSANSQSSTTGASALDASFADSGTDESLKYAVFATSEASGGPSISSTTDPVVDGVQSSITISGLTGTLSATLGGETITLGGTNPDLTYTQAWGTISSNTTAPRMGEIVQLAVTGNEGTATANVVTSPASGYAAVTLTSKDVNSFLASVDSEFGITTDVGTIVHYATAGNTTVGADGLLTTDLTDTNIEMFVQAGGDSTTPANTYPFEINASTGGVTARVIRTRYRRFPWQAHHKT